MEVPDGAHIVDLAADQQRRLSELLTVDLDLACTFLGLARTRSNPESARASLDHAITAINGIRKLLRRVEDAGLQDSIETRLQELEGEIRRLTGESVSQS